MSCPGDRRCRSSEASDDCGSDSTHTVCDFHNVFHKHLFKSSDLLPSVASPPTEGTFAIPPNSCHMCLGAVGEDAAGAKPKFS